MAQSNPLRPITQRLNSTPVEELPRYAGFLAASILNCSPLLKDVENFKSESSVQVHKLATRVSSLCQDRTQEGRFTGVVLIKALVEAIGPQTLATSGSSWTRSLISCLNKQDPPQLKKLVIVTVTRIFLLTKGNQTMTREITTPSLPAFVTACLNAIKPVKVSKGGSVTEIPNPLVQSVFQCWIPLIRSFPSTFRPFAPSIRSIVLSLLAQDGTSHQVKDMALQLFTTIHFCAPKDNSASEWLETVELVIEAIHQSADSVFRSVVEEWSGNAPRQPRAPTGKRAALEVQTSTADAIGMEKWTGLWVGCSRLTDLIHLLEQMLTNEQAQMVKIPVSGVLNLTARLAAVLVPTKEYSLRENKEIGRDEREELFLHLPRLHCAVLELYKSLVATFGRGSASVVRTILSQVWDIFDSESFDVVIRTNVYLALQEILCQSPDSMHVTDTRHVGELIQRCCTDLRLLYSKGTETPGSAKDIKSGKINVEVSHQSKQQVRTDHQRFGIQEKAAWELLPVLLSHLPPTLLTSTTRAEIDRTAILIGHEKALLASVMNPPMPKQGARRAPSMLPFLARTGDDSLAFEALMRPRRPVLRDVEQTGTVETGEEHTASPPMEASDIDEMNIDAITTHVEQQLEHTATDDGNDETLPQRKRDYTATEDATSGVVESSKRTKTVEPESLSNQSSTVPIVEVPDGGMRSVSSLGFNLTREEGAKPAQVVQAPDMAQSSTVSVPTETKNVAMPPNVGQDEDSDDSEIPQIDTAFSSDDEDEDEDEES